MSPLYGGEISTSTTNGETVVIWNGKEVWKGTTEGGLKAVASTLDGKELGAAIAENGMVVWESEPGAAREIGTVRSDVEKLIKQANQGVEVSTDNGESVVKYEGKQVWRGRTSGDVSARSKTENGKAYAAAFDGGKVIWENVPGAAKKVGGPPPKGPGR